jgi:hypothetical protein
MIPAVDPAVATLAALAIALLFASAGLGKLRDAMRFRATLDAYRVLPAALVPAASRALPCVELMLAAALIDPASRALAAALSAAVLLVYGAGIGINLWRGRRELDCGCEPFGQRRPIAAWMLARNALLGAVALLAVLPSTRRALEAVDALTILGGLSVLVPAYLAAEQLLAGHPAPRRDAVQA